MASFTSVPDPLPFSGGGTLGGVGHAAVSDQPTGTNFGGTGALAGTQTLIKVNDVPAFGSVGTLSIAPVVKFTGSCSFGGSGQATAVGAKILFRDAVGYDGGNTNVDNFQVTPPASIKNGDYGFLLVSWVAQTGDPVSISASSLDPDGITLHNWDVIEASQQSNQMCFAVLARKFVSSTDAGAPVTIQLGGSRYITAAAAWWSGVDSVDNVGVVGTREGASSGTTTAPGVLTRAVNGETVVLLYAERSPTAGTSATLSEGLQRIFLEGSGQSTCSVLIGDVIWPNFGTTDDIVATYNTPSTNGMAVQIALLPLNATVGAQVPLGSTGTLSAAGTDTTKIAPFASQGTLSATGIPIGQADFSGSGQLSMSPVVFGSAHFSGSGSLGALGTPSASGSAALSGSGTLAGAGSPAFAQITALSGAGSLAGVGVPLTVGVASFSSVASLSGVATARPVAQVGFASDGALISIGIPQVASPSSQSGAGVLSTDTLVSLSGSTAVAGTGTLVTVGILVQAAGSVSLGGSGTLSAVGTPDFEPVTVVFFGGTGTLSIEGFRPQIPPALITHQPYYVRQKQDWAVQQERQRHIQAIYQVGEPALFVLMWKVEDFEAGLVTPCPRCRPETGDVDARVAAIYQQPQTAKCPFCFGTTYEGGVRAKIVRPAIFTDADEDERKSARGVTHAEPLMVETVDDFRSRTGDYVFRRDGSRWQLGHPARDMLRTGYEHPTQAGMSLGYARIPASREDASSVVFDIPPIASELAAILVEPLHYPVPTA